MIEFKDRENLRITIMEDKIAAFYELKDYSGLSKTKVYLQNSDPLILNLNYDTFIKRLFS